MIKSNTWYPFLKKYDSCYLTIDDNDKTHIFNNEGIYLTSTYHLSSPGNTTEMKTLSWVEHHEDFVIYHTCYVEFTTEGILYSIGEYYERNEAILYRTFDYFFASYEEE